MRIQHNIAAMNAYRNYNTNTSAVSKNLEKLSSGYKINRAGDDAAGLAISEKMRAQISGLNAASKNVKDGISLVKTAEGAMQEVQDMLNRMVTLSTQSANGTYDNEVDRANLQKEVDQLRAEINRIADSSNFNGIKLLDGSQEIKTSYTNLSSPSATQDLGFKIISDGQLGVDAQAGVFSYDLSQLKITVGGGNGTPDPTSIQTLTGSQAVSDPNWIEGTPTTVPTSQVKIEFNASAGASATELKASTAVATGATLKITIGSKSYTFTAGSAAGSATASGATVAKGSNGAKFLQNVQMAAQEVLKKANAAAASAAGSTGYTKVDIADVTFANGKVTVNATTSEMKPRYVKGPAASIAASVSGLASAAVSAFGSSASIGATAAAALNGKTLTITAGSQTVTVALASNAVTATMSGSAALAAVNAAIKAEVDALNATAKGSGGNYNELNVTLDKTGKVTATTTPVTDNAPDASGRGTYSLSFGGKTITLRLKAGEYSGADLAKEIANAINTAGKASAAGSASGSTASQIMLLAGSNGTVTPGQGGTPFDGELKGAKITASFNGSKLTITMDEPPKDTWDVDMTLKFHNGNGNGGEQFKPTVDVEPMDSLTKREYAQATIDLSKLPIKDGYSIQLGKTTYTFAIGSDSRFKNAANVVDLTDLTQKDIDGDGTGTSRGVIVAANRLSKAAAANATFLVGSDTVGGISLTEKEGAIDYAVNNLAGADGKGTAGEGNSIKDDAGHDAEGAAGAHAENADATVSDWKGLVKWGQASVSGNGLTLQIGDTSDSYNQLTVSIGDIHTKALGINDIDIGTQTGAQAAVNTIKTAINSVSSIRGTLGATQNRLEHTANNLSVMAENIQDAESTIRDTDVAEEMMSYTKNNILVQSAQAMLAQANQIPQGVLQLLG